MRAILLAVVMVLATVLAAQAQTVTVNDVLTQAGAKEGVMLDLFGKGGVRGLNFLAATVYQGTGVFKNLSLDAGLVGTDGIGLAADYDIGSALPKINFPVLNLANYLHVGFGGYCKTVTFLTNAEQTTKDDNKLGGGPTLFVKWNF